MGAKYRDVVIRCLNGDFGIEDESDRDADGSRLQRSFWSKVIGELEECHV